MTSGTATLKDAVNEAMRDWVTNVETTHYVLGSAMGPHPYPTIVRDLQRVLGDEAAAQLRAVEGRLPDLVLACVGGGSNAIGLLDRFIGEPSVRLAVAEAAGDGIATGRHAAALAGGTPGILHGSRSLMLQDRDGQVVEAHSISAGLDYPGVGPQIAALVDRRPARAGRRDRRRGARGRPRGRPGRGDPAGPRDGPRLRRPAPAAGRDRGLRCAVPGRDGRPARTLRARRQGPRRARDGGGPVSAVDDRSPDRRPRRPSGHERDAPAHAGSPPPSPRRGRRPVAPRSSRTSSPATPTRRRSFRIALAAADAGADLLEVGLPYSDPLADGATLQRASGVALARRGHLRRARSRSSSGSRAARPGVPLVPMAYANQVIGGGDGGPTAAPARRGRRERDHRGRPDARRGRAVRGRGPRRPGSRSSTSSRRRPRPSVGRRIAAPDRRVPLLRLARRRDRRPRHAAARRSAGSSATSRAVSPVPVAVGFGVSRPAHVRALVAAGADGVIVASALVDALGPDGRDVAALGRPSRTFAPPPPRRLDAADAPRPSRYPRPMHPDRIETAEAIGPSGPSAGPSTGPAGAGAGGTASGRSRRSSGQHPATPSWPPRRVSTSRRGPARVTAHDLLTLETLTGGGATDISRLASRSRSRSRSAPEPRRSPGSAAGRSRGGPPGGSGPRSPSPPAAAPRAPARGRGAVVQPWLAFSRPTSRAARPLARSAARRSAGRARRSGRAARRARGSPPGRPGRGAAPRRRAARRPRPVGRPRSSARW